jgi:radical SAM superfamily enzyme YgiQ (UPF0313 family)
MFDRFSKEAGKEAVPDSVLHRRAPRHHRFRHDEPGLWLKKNGFRADQVQAFYPSPMATATAMYHSGKNPLRKVTRDSETVDIVKGDRAAACTRPSCATTTPTTGRCCARR